VTKDALTLVARALRRAAPVLAADPAQLAGQLVARLGDDPDARLRALCESARPPGDATWLRPVTPGLKGLGDADVLSLPVGWDAEPVFVEHEGRTLLAIRGDEGYAIWDVRVGEHLADVPPVGAVGRMDAEHLTCGQIGDRFAVLTVDGERSAVTAWMPDSPAPAWRFEAPTRAVDDYARVRTVAVGGDVADALAAVVVEHRANEPSRIFLLDPTTGAIRRAIDADWTTNRTVFGGANGRSVLAAASVTSVQVLDCARGDVIGSVRSKQVFGRRGPLALGRSVDGWVLASTAATEEFEKGVAVWDVATGDQIAFLVMDDVVSAVFAARLETCLLVIGRVDRVSAKGSVHVWDVRAEREVSTIPLASEHAAGVAVRPASPPWLLATVTDHAARVWDLDRLLEGGLVVPPHEAEVTAAAFGPAAASADRGGVVRTWTDDGRPDDRFEVPGAVLGLAWCEIGGADALAVATDREIHVLERGSGRSVQRISVGRSVEEGTLAAIEVEDGRWYVAVETSRIVNPDQIDPGDSDAELGQPVNVHQVEVFDVATGSRRYELSRFTTPLAWRLDGRPVFVVIGRYGSGSIVDAASGATVAADASGHGVAGTAVNVAALGHALGDGGVTLASVGGELAAPVGDDATPWVAISQRHEVRVWDLGVPRSLTAFTVDDRVTCFAVRRDGRRLIVGDSSGAVHHLELIRGTRDVRLDRGPSVRGQCLA
jgi:hypothetical protein